MNSKITKISAKFYNGALNEAELIDKYFYQKDIFGKEYFGISGFEKQNYNDNIKQNIIAEFKSNEILKSRNDFDLIEITSKFKEKFKLENYVDHVYICEFYTFGNIGKTKFGWDLHLAKGDSNIKVINFFAKLLYQKYLELNKTYQFDYIGFVPPTLKGRKIQIIDFIRDYFLIQNGDLKIINISKIDGMPAQKSISKFTDRIENSKNSFFVGENRQNLGNILLIDDAIGSGCSINYLIGTLKSKNQLSKTVGLGIVGSQKGFDIIKEI